MSARELSEPLQLQMEGGYVGWISKDAKEWRVNGPDGAEVKRGRITRKNPIYRKAIRRGGVPPAVARLAAAMAAVALVVPSP